MARIKPIQKRSEERRATIVAAAKDVIDEVGRDRFTTDMIAKRAECSIGTIYRYFADRVDILDELYPNRVEGLDPEGLIHGRR